MRFVVCLSCFFGVGCASIMSGTTQHVKINSHPPGATVHVDDQDKDVLTPATLVLRRKDPHTLLLTLEGCEPKKIYIDQKMNPWVWGNILLGGLIGTIVDWCTGGCNSLTPAEINVTFKPQPPLTEMESTNVPPVAVAPAARQETEASGKPKEEDIEHAKP